MAASWRTELRRAALVAFLLSASVASARADGFQPFWAQSFTRDTPLWSAGDAGAVFLGSRPQWTYFYVVGQSGDRYYALDSTTGDYAYVDARSVGPATPPAAVVARVLGSAPSNAAAGAAAAATPPPASQPKPGDAALAAANRYYQALNSRDYAGAYAMLSKYYRTVRTLDSISSQNSPLNGIRLSGTRVMYADSAKAFLETSVVKTQAYIDQNAVGAMRWVFENGRWALDGEGGDLFFTSGNWDPNNPVSVVYAYYLMVEAKYFDQAYATLLSPAFHQHTPPGDIAYQFNGSGAFTARSINLVDMGTVQGRVGIVWPDANRTYVATWHLAPYPQGIMIDAIDWNEVR